MAQAVAYFDNSTSAAHLQAPWSAAANAASAFNFSHDLEPDEANPLVVVIENDPHTRSMLVGLLQSSHIRVVAFASPNELMDADLRDQPGCFILDVQLPGLSGLDFYQQLNAIGLNQPVIFLTGHGDTQLTVRAMKAGAVDFLLKPVRDQILLEGVACAIALDRKRRDAAKHLCIQTERVAALTPREFQVMQGVALGRLNKQIAYDLGISEITVKAHRGNVMRKLQARSICDVVRIWDMLPPQLQANAGLARRTFTIV